LQCCHFSYVLHDHAIFSVVALKFKAVATHISFVCVYCIQIPCLPSFPNHFLHFQQKACFKDLTCIVYICLLQISIFMTPLCLSASSLINEIEHRHLTDFFTLLMCEGFCACQQNAGQNYNIKYM